MAEFEASVDIAARPEFVFGFLTTIEGMNAWMGQWSDLDAREGGRFDVDIAGSPVRGTFLEVDPPRRVVVSWGFPGSDDLPAGASTVAFTLTPISIGTRVDLLHSGLPERHVPGHTDGWQHFLERLGRAATGEALEVDTWRSANPAM